MKRMAIFVEGANYTDEYDDDTQLRSSQNIATEVWNDEKVHPVNSVFVKGHQENLLGTVVVLELTDEVVINYYGEVCYWRVVEE